MRVLKKSKSAWVAISRYLYSSLLLSAYIIHFELATGEMYRVDLAENGEAVPKYKRADSELSEYIKEL